MINNRFTLAGNLPIIKHQMPRKNRNNIVIGDDDADADAEDEDNKDEGEEYSVSFAVEVPVVTKRSIVQKIQDQLQTMETNLRAEMQTQMQTQMSSLAYTHALNAATIDPTIAAAKLEEYAAEWIPITKKEVYDTAVKEDLPKIKIELSRVAEEEIKSYVAERKRKIDEAYTTNIQDHKNSLTAEYKRLTTDHARKLSDERQRARDTLFAHEQAVKRAQTQQQQRVAGKSIITNAYRRY
jgi:hypothetical protein